MAAIPRVQTADRTLNQIQENFNQALKLLLANPLISGNLLTGVRLQSGSNTINHGLNRTLQGWIIVGISGAAQVFDQQASNLNPSQSLVLSTSAAVTANIYVF